ncbi:hypothetical protein [Rhodoferax sp. UBA5149]|uniref:hypothetical protein n=1 Tax=Rhodoferax sp. UBA5149 TaxID=1947379 RepID=UPI0025E55666|nr:hypothetical protein [Rhodoferax sp. UBA5149]
MLIPGKVLVRGIVHQGRLQSKSDEPGTGDAFQPVHGALQKDPKKQDDLRVQQRVFKTFREHFL